MSARSLEVCVEDARGIAAAVAGGADRIELCAALDVGGLTPPASLVRAAALAPVPVHLLARPRAGDFRYDVADRALIADDISTAAEAGLAGVVIGASDAGGRLDAECLAGWIAHARHVGAARGRSLSLTLHRAFDLVPDLSDALEVAVTLGFDRILTSGGSPRAVEAVAALTRLVTRAGERIVILAGSGVSAATLPAILASGVREVHASCRGAAVDPAPDLLRFGFVAAGAKTTDVATVATLAGMVHGLE